MYVARVVADPRFTAALRVWAACAREAGLPYGSPQEIRAGLPALLNGKNPANAHELEVRLATAEATCERRSALAQTGRDLSREHGAEARREYAGELETYRRLQAVALSRARVIVNQHSPTRGAQQ